MRKRLLFVGVIVAVSLIIGRMEYNSRPDLLKNNAKEQQRKISFFTEKHEWLLESFEYNYKESPIIIEAEATGDYQYAKQNLIQKVKIVKIIKREEISNSQDEVAYVIGNGWDEGNGVIATGYINYMQKGDKYILFVNDIKYDERSDSKIIVLNQDLMGMRYLNISEDSSFAYETDMDSIEYGKVKDSEFFCNDKGTLKAIMDMKHRVLSEFGIKTYY